MIKLGKLLFFDRVNVLNSKTSKSEFSIKNEINLIESKTIFQSDCFSHKNEKLKNNNEQNFYKFESFCLKDKSNDTIIKNTNLSLEERIFIEDKFVNNFNNEKYKILFPKNENLFNVGENIKFECGIITNNELQSENFEKIIWISSLDGLIGIGERFETMLTYGEHFISLMMVNDEIKILKDKIKIIVSFKETNSPEINKQ